MFIGLLIFQDLWIKELSLLTQMTLTILVQASHTPLRCGGSSQLLGNSANTDSFHQAKGEPGQALVPTPTLETNKQTTLTMTGRGQLPPSPLQGSTSPVLGVLTSQSCSEFKCGHKSDKSDNTATSGRLVSVRVANFPEIFVVFCFQNCLDLLIKVKCSYGVPRI